MGSRSALGDAPVPLSLILREKQEKRKKRRDRRRRTSIALSSTDKEEIIRGVCSGRFAPVGGIKQQTARAADEMASLCAELHAEYYGSRVSDWQSRLQQNKGHLGCCSRAAAQADMLGVCYRDYLRAQFYWINDYFSRPPRYSEIASPGAIVRYEKWKIVKEDGQAPPMVVHPAIMGNIDPRDQLDSDVIEYEKIVLERMVRQWGSEEEVWRMFGSPEDTEVFSSVFKKTREVWRSMYGKDL